MVSKERVLAALERKSADRTPLWSGKPKEEIVESLLRFYEVRDWEALLRRIGDDFRQVEKLPLGPP
jgi:hypothetical protein